MKLCRPMMEPIVLRYSKRTQNCIVENTLNEDRIRMIEKRENAHHRNRSEFNYNCVIAMTLLGVTNMMNHVGWDVESKNVMVQQAVRYVCFVMNAHSNGNGSIRCIQTCMSRDIILWNVKSAFLCPFRVYTLVKRCSVVQHK